MRPGPLVAVPYPQSIIYVPAPGLPPCRHSKRYVFRFSLLHLILNFSQQRLPPAGPCLRPMRGVMRPQINPPAAFGRSAALMSCEYAPAPLPHGTGCITVFLLGGNCLHKCLHKCLHVRNARPCILGMHTRGVFTVCTGADPLFVHVSTHSSLQTQVCSFAEFAEDACMLHLPCPVPLQALIDAPI